MRSASFATGPLCLWDANSLGLGMSFGIALGLALGLVLGLWPCSGIALRFCIRFGLNRAWPRPALLALSRYDGLDMLG